jgi:urate oxidase
MSIVLGPNQYGKAEVRLVHVERSTPRHVITDLTVTTQLRGDFTAAHLQGDNAHVVPTDTQKNTVYAFARDGVGEPEDFALRLGRHFLDGFPWVTGARIAVDASHSDRIPVDGVEHDHAFVQAGAERRSAVLNVTGDQAWVVAGISDLVVLKSTGSEFTGYPVDAYTTLQETTDRILATAVTARWRYTGVDLPFGDLFPRIRTILLETFASLHSLALQQTLYAMGRAVLEAVPEVAELRFSMPNKHHFLVDLAPFGLDNPNTVFYAADRPYGLIEATVIKDDAPPAGDAWLGIPGFV